MSKQKDHLVIANPNEPATLDQLVEAVRSWLAWCVMSGFKETDQNWIANQCRDYHRRAYYFGVRNLPKFPTAAGMTDAEAEGFLIELKHAMGDDRPYVFFEGQSRISAQPITFEDVKSSFQNHQQETRRVAARATNRMLSVAQAANLLNVSKRHVNRLVTKGMALTIQGIEAQR